MKEKRKKPGRKGFNLNYKEISQEYLNGAQLNELGTKYNVSIWTLLDNFKKLGIRKTTKRYYNTKIFSTFTKENCYWAGFIAADGSVDNYALEIELSKKDENHLFLFKDFLESNAEIKYRTRENREYCSIQIYSKKIVDDLKENFNIISNKSLILQPPNKIPEELIKSFIRGYFDGDGHVGWNIYNHCIKFHTCSGSLKITEWILNNIKNYNNVGKRNIRTRWDGLTSIEFSGLLAIGIFNWLYEDSIEKLRLKRKFNLFNKLVEKHNLRQKGLEFKKQNKKLFINSLLELYNKGNTYKEIAQKFNISLETVSYYLKPLKKNKRLELKLIARNKQIFEMYINNISMKEIAKKFNISISSCFKICKKQKELNVLS
jgi:DNA-binding CsgD family transcriptional regulator